MLDLLQKGLKQNAAKSAEKEFEGRRLSIGDNLSDRTRPQRLEDVVMPQRMKTFFAHGTIKQNYLFYGLHGRGKTTLAYILARKFKLLDLNDTFDRGLEFLSKVESFCTTHLDTNGKHKAVIIDEADKLTSAVQDGLKTLLEHTKVKFIFITNNYSKLSAPLHSRLIGVNFDYNKEETEEMAMLLLDYYNDIPKKYYKCTFGDDSAFFIRKNKLDVRKSVTEIETFFTVYKPTKETLRDENGNFIVTLSDLSVINTNTVAKGGNFFKILTSNTKTRLEVAQFVRENYFGNEQDAFELLEMPFFEYLMRNGQGDAFITLAQQISDYHFKSLHLPVKLVPLIALCEIIRTKFS